VADVLESMFFREAPAEIPEMAADQDAMTVHVTFEGDPPGCFRMRLARTAANAIAADFLGEDAGSVSRQQSTDVALELGNMICGAVLSRIESSATFRLGSPRVLAAGIDETLPAGAILYTVETGSGPLTVGIGMETRTCPQTEKYAF
jgi:hypothetical protein